MTVTRGRTGIMVLALCGVSTLARAQDFSGVYTMTGNGTTITLTLQQAAAGRITGSLTGNTAFQIEATIQQGLMVGYATAPTGRLFIQAQPSGSELQVLLAEVGPDGQAQQNTARTFTMTRGGGATAMAQPMNAPVPMRGAAPSPGGAGADPVAGTWANDEMQVVFQGQGSTYNGTATFQGETYPIQAQYAGGMLQGQYAANGQVYPFQAQVQGAQMQISADGQIIVLQRQGGAGPARGAGGRAAAPQPGSMGGGTAQDQQLRQLLLGSAWCSFQYSQVSGATSTERVVFRADGSGAISSGRESLSSGPNGSVFGSSSGGEAFQWTTRGGQLYINGELVPGTITTNSNGSPIINANGKEYSMCR